MAIGAVAVVGSVRAYRAAVRHAIGDASVGSFRGWQAWMWALGIGLGSVVATTLLALVQFTLRWPDSRALRWLYFGLAVVTVVCGLLIVFLPREPLPGPPFTPEA